MLPLWREAVRVWGLSRAFPTRRRVTLSAADPTAAAKGFCGVVLDWTGNPGKADREAQTLCCPIALSVCRLFHGMAHSRAVRIISVPGCRYDTIDAGDLGGKDSHGPRRSRRPQYFSQRTPNQRQAGANCLGCQLAEVTGLGFFSANIRMTITPLPKPLLQLYWC